MASFKPILVGTMIFIISVIALSPAFAGAGDSPPSVWMMPPPIEDGRCFRDLFVHPNEWRMTRSRIDGIGYADHWLNTQFTNQELKTWFARLRAWHLKLGLEVGAVKPWSTQGAKTFQIERKMWDRFQSLGGHIDAIGMDEPFCCVRQDLKKPDSYAVEQTADFIALVRKYYPQIKVGDIEPYPFFSLKDLEWWIVSLNNRLAQLHVRGLDFFRLDTNWITFSVYNQGSWQQVRQLEMYCRSRRLPFSLIYWASDFPVAQSLGLADDATWYTSVMQEGYDYALAGGSPDQYYIESWVDGPTHTLPETDRFTFTRSVLDFCRRFVKGKH